jgi:hypothetical protein
MALFVPNALPQYSRGFNDTEAKQIVMQFAGSDDRAVPRNFMLRRDSFHLDISKYVMGQSYSDPNYRTSL